MNDRFHIYEHMTKHQTAAAHVWDSTDTSKDAEAKFLCGRQFMWRTGGRQVYTESNYEFLCFLNVDYLHQEFVAGGSCIGIGYYVICRQCLQAVERLLRAVATRPAAADGGEE